MEHDTELNGQDWRAAFYNSSDRLIEVASELRIIKEAPMWRRIWYAIFLK